jgi:formate dehydrogenase subunit gamma
MPTDDPQLQAVRAIAAQHRHTPGGLMPALHQVQDTLGHVPEAAVPVLAQTFNLSRAEVHGVVSYYHHFRREPAGRHVLQICRAEACQAMGADALVEHAQRRLGCRLGERTEDGGVTLESVYCLGLCASSPALTLDDTPHARVSMQRFDALIAPLRRVVP